MNQELENYIEQQLGEWGDELVTEMKGAIDRLKANDTEDLRESFKTRVNKLRLELSFNEYGRMRDMGTGSGGRGKAVESVKKNKKEWQGRKPAKFYSKTAYGMLNGLIEKVIFGYQEKTAETVKNALQ